LGCFEEIGKLRGREKRESEAREGFLVSSLEKLMNAHSFSVAPPDLRHSESCVDGELMERGTGEVNLYEEVRRRVLAQVELSLSLDASYVLDVKAGVGLEPAFQVLAPEGRRPEAPSVQIQLRDQRLHEEGEGAVQLLTFFGWTHDLQRTSVIGQAKRAAFPELSQQPLVGLPAHVVENDSLLDGCGYRGFHGFAITPR
jgi:hypothetical protein